MLVFTDRRLRVQLEQKSIFRDGHRGATLCDLSDRFPDSPLASLPKYQVQGMAALQLLSGVMLDAEETVARAVIDLLLKRVAKGGPLAELDLDSGEAIGTAFILRRWSLVQPLLQHVLATGLMQKSKWSGVNMLAVWPRIHGTTCCGAHTCEL